jgi:hypothetical protein
LIRDEVPSEEHTEDVWCEGATGVQSHEQYGDWQRLHIIYILYPVIDCCVEGLRGNMSGSVDQGSASAHRSINISMTLPFFGLAGPALGTTRLDIVGVERQDMEVEEEI